MEKTKIEEITDLIIHIATDTSMAEVSRRAAIETQLREISKPTFFAQLMSVMADKETLQIALNKNENTFTMSVIPVKQGAKASESKITPLTLTGYPADFEDEFFPKLTAGIEKARGLISKDAKPADTVTNNRKSSSKKKSTKEETEEEEEEETTNDKSKAPTLFDPEAV